MALQCYTLFMLVLSVRGYEILKYHENENRQIEKDHSPYWLNIPWMLNGTQYMWNVNGTENTLGQSHTPNWMMQEPPFRPWFHQFKRKYPYQEINRPYRLFPTSHVVERWNKLNVYDTVSPNVGCYCTTAWKVYTPLAGCAVLTARHILTTATSTELVLKKVQHLPKLDRILGFWYEMYNLKAYNNSYYESVSRIHYHPQIEWGEYFCIGGQTESYAKYGIESGAAYHRLIAEYRPAYWQGYDGLAAMCAFSMNLRSEGLVHYFTVLNVHHVLDWIYDAYTGKQDFRWLDYRYQDTKGKAPIPKVWHYVRPKWYWPAATPYALPIPFY